MSRIALAFSAFFRLLTGRQLPPAAAAYLPASPAKELPPAPPTAAPTAAAPAAEPARKDAKDAPKAAEPARDERKSSAAAHQDGALALLALLQREGRLVDFLRESLDAFSDADIGAAARDVHRGCKKVLEQHLTLEPVMPGEEEAQVTVPKGFDPGEVRLVGEARGEPPFRGTLRHHGWRATAVKLPALTEGVDRAVLAPAEVELGA
ncbi:MAG: DUF2760 domain-containing protein [Kofleriaceae bacterium]